jgi:predicted helicase
MYARFFRWASDRLTEDGVLAFITNRSFVDAQGFDGFRRIVAKDFSEGWVVDLGGDFKKKGFAGSGNVFGIGTGVAVSFWVKSQNHVGKMKLWYIASPLGTAEDKLSWLANQPMDGKGWQQLEHRDDAAWVDIPDVSTAGMLPIADKKTKDQESSGQDRAIFKLYSLGVSTNRDDWLYSISKKDSSAKAKALIDGYSETPRFTSDFGTEIKWSRNLKRRLLQGRKESFNAKLSVLAAYRPFCKRWLYQSSLYVDELGLVPRLFPVGSENRAICFSDKGFRAEYCVQAVDGPTDLHFGASLDGYQQVARYRYTKSGEQVDNITDWAVAQFEANYGSDLAITKDAIFAYCYAVLHDPLYREKYALNLKREFPRIPFYPDFAQWVAWGEALLKLHVDYEKVKPAKLIRVDTPAPKRAEGTHPKPKLRSNPEAGNIIIDEDTQLTGVPVQAWQYRLGNRSAIDWVLDQHKEKTPRDPTIRKKFNTYRFADYKESCIELLGKVVKVSVDTMAITEAMKALDRSGWEK